MNWVAVAAATLAYYLLGAVWFTPLLGRTWDRAIGFERPAGFRFPAIYYVVPLVSSLLIASSTAVIIVAVGITALPQALLLALAIGLGYLAISATNALTPTTPRPLLLGAVTGSYHFVGIIVVATILVVWR